MPSLPSPLLHCKWILALLLLLVVAGVGAQSAGSIEGELHSLHLTCSHGRVLNKLLANLGGPGGGGGGNYSSLHNC